MKAIFPLACLAAWCSSMLAQSLSAPVAGRILDNSGGMSVVHGVLSCLLPPAPFALPPDLVGETIVAAAFSSASGVLKTSSQVIVLDAQGAVQSRMPAPAGSASFAFDAAGVPQWACFPASSRLASLDGKVSLDTTLYGDRIIGLGLASVDSLQILADSGTPAQLWAETVDLPSGTVRSQTPIPGSGPAVFLERGWLVKGDRGLLWLETGLPPLPVAFPEDVVTMQAAGTNAAAINGQWLFIASSELRLLRIPSAVRPSSRRREILQ